MPEKPEIKGTEHIILKRNFKKLHYYLQIIPLCFSTGSKKRAYTSLTVDASKYESNLQQTSLPSLPSWVRNQQQLYAPWPPSSWRDRARNESWDYLLEGSPSLGELICVTRGKLMILAAGHHATVISFGLEAHIFSMTPSLYWRIVTNDIPGANPDPVKADRIRRFIVPTDCKVEDSSPVEPRTIKMFASFVSEERVFVLADFSGLVRMHVVSKSSPWTLGDLAVGSTYWNWLFMSFKGGPDWHLETELAKSALRLWRTNILEEQEVWKLKCRLFDKQSNITSYFPSKKTSKHRPGRPACPLRPILEELCDNSSGSFSGFGRHTANDFCFLQAMFPGMPSFEICNNNDTFARFENDVYNYLTTFTTTQFFEHVCRVEEPENPFAFNESSNDAYMEKYIHVFRRSTCKVPRDLYIKYAEKGLFDPDHVIGEPYPVPSANLLLQRLGLGSLSTKETASTSQISTRHQSKRRRLDVPNESNSAATTDSEDANSSKGVDASTKLKTFVWKRNYFVAGIRGYSIISAKPPPQWGVFAARKRVSKDISNYNYTTTIGLAQFREQVLNRRIIFTVKRGRPPKGQKRGRGRKPKVSSTREDHAQWKKRQTGRRRPADEEDAISEEFDDEGDSAKEIMTDETDDELESSATTPPSFSAPPLVSLTTRIRGAQDNPGDANKDGDATTDILASGRFIQANESEYDADSDKADSGEEDDTRQSEDGHEEEDDPKADVPVPEHSSFPKSYKERIEENPDNVDNIIENMSRRSLEALNNNIRVAARFARTQGPYHDFWATKSQNPYSIELTKRSHKKHKTRGTASLRPRHPAAAPQHNAPPPRRVLPDGFFNYERACDILELIDLDFETLRPYYIKYLQYGTNIYLRAVRQKK